MAGSCVANLEQTIFMQTSLRAPVPAVPEGASGACVGSVSVNFWLWPRHIKYAQGMQFLVGWREGRGCHVPGALCFNTKCDFCLCVKGKDCFPLLGLPPDSGRKIFPRREMLLC